MKVHAKCGKNTLKTEPFPDLALTSDFLHNGKELDLRAPDNGKVYGDTRVINTTGKMRLVKEWHGRSDLS